MALTFDAATKATGFTLPDWLKPKPQTPAPPMYDDISAIPIPGIDDLPPVVTPAQQQAAATAEQQAASFRKYMGRDPLPGEYEQLLVTEQAAAGRPPLGQAYKTPVGYPPNPDAFETVMAQGGFKQPEVAPSPAPVSRGFGDPSAPQFNPHVFNAEIDEAQRRNAISNSTAAGYQERRNPDGSLTITGSNGREFILVAPPESKSVNKDYGVGGTPALNRYLSSPVEVAPFGGVNDAASKFGPGGDPNLTSLGNPYATQYQGTEYGGIVPLYPWGDAPPDTRQGMADARTEFDKRTGVEDRKAAQPGPEDYSGVPLAETASIPEGTTGTTVTGKKGSSIAGDYWENGIVPVDQGGTPIPADTAIPPGVSVTYYKMTGAELAAYRASIGYVAPEQVVGNQQPAAAQPPAPVGFVGDVAPVEGGAGGITSPAPAATPPAAAPPAAPAAPPAPAGPPPEVQIREWVAANAIPGRAIPIPESASAGSLLSQWPAEATIYYYNAAGTKKIVKETNARLEPGVQYYLDGITAAELKTLQGGGASNARTQVAQDIEYTGPAGPDSGGLTDAVPPGYRSPFVEDRRGDPPAPPPPTYPPYTLDPVPGAPSAMTTPLYDLAAWINNLDDAPRNGYYLSTAGQTALARLQAAGWTVYEDGSVIPPGHGTISGDYGEVF